MPRIRMSAIPDTGEKTGGDTLVNMSCFAILKQGGE